MGFVGTCGQFLGSVLLCAVGAAGQSSVTVVVNNSARVRSDVLSKAEAETARLFQEAGISIHWLHCGETDACRRRPLHNELILHVVPTGKTQSDFVFGEAFLGEDGRGQYCDVFFDRIKAAQENTDGGRLLGVVAAHELGHLLLGSRAHSRVGIMEPIWEQESVRKLGMGLLLFTPDQARFMRRRIAEEDRLQVQSFSKTEGEIGLLCGRTPALRF
jgi:hypothetical protein